MCGRLSPGGNYESVVCGFTRKKEAQHRDKGMRHRYTYPPKVHAVFYDSDKTRNTRNVRAWDCKGRDKLAVKIKSPAGESQPNRENTSRDFLIIFHVSFLKGIDSTSRRAYAADFSSKPRHNGDEMLSTTTKKNVEGEREDDNCV
ncbi:hypothetical protein OUZ56_028309 [Daphnia magna]|uniref:Uncharacterized protein n=1 Tax=Daphnia magna TaxID=35525 RepID=A0ABR0B3G9_9CRUS|nr:hypothetical protein OUZ56_028309 [Daphnia magna]